MASSAIARRIKGRSWPAPASCSPTLTGGSFARLTIDDDDGQSVLKGIRPDGRLVGVEGMSDGSHDQLYLALRLASLESWLQSHEPIPFIVDDILLNFDDQRATAALGALAELSRQDPGLVLHSPSPPGRPGPHSHSPRRGLHPRAAGGEHSSIVIDTYLLSIAPRAP